MRPPPLLAAPRRKLENWLGIPMPHHPRSPPNDGAGGKPAQMRSTVTVKTLSRLWLRRSGRSAAWGAASRLGWRRRLRLWFGVATVAGIATRLGISARKRRQILRIDRFRHRDHDPRGLLLRLGIRGKVRPMRLCVFLMAEGATHAEVDRKLPHLFDQIGPRNVLGKDLEVGELLRRGVAGGLLSKSRGSHEEAYRKCHAPRGPAQLRLRQNRSFPQSHLLLIQFVESVPPKLFRRAEWHNSTAFSCEPPALSGGFDRQGAGVRLRSRRGRPWETRSEPPSGAG
jgi:hypothetical protein